MLVAAPGRFSTTNCWPRYSESFGASSRAMMSVPPPGVKPTSMRTGLVGYACAEATELASRRSSDTTSFIELFPESCRHRQSRVVGGSERAVGRDAEAFEDRDDLARVLGGVPCRALEELVQRVAAVVQLER